MEPQREMIDNFQAHRPSYACKCSSAGTRIERLNRYIIEEQMVDKKFKLHISKENITHAPMLPWDRTRPRPKRRQYRKFASK